MFLYRICIANSQHDCNMKFKMPHKGADDHRRQRLRLVVIYLQSQSQASSLGQCGHKMQWILVISTFHELRSHVTAKWGRNSEIWPGKAVD